MQSPKRLEAILEIKYFKSVLRILSALIIATVMLGQTSPRQVSSTEAEAHLLTRSDPVLSPLAKAARIGGTVTIEIVISPQGNVSSEKVISGHPLLVQEAIDIVKKWKYKPFLDNEKAVAVVTKVNVDFPGGMSAEESEIRKKLFAVEDECRGLLNAKKYPEAELKCGEALKLSNTLPADVVLEKSSARSLLAHSVLLQGRVTEAIPIYEEALALDKGYLSSDDADLAIDYLNLARAYATNRDFAKADGLYAMSISTVEAAIKRLPQEKENYTPRLNRALLEYAQLKEIEGQSDKAAELRKKASSK